MGEWGVNGSVQQRQVSHTLTFPATPSRQTPSRELSAPLAQEGNSLSYRYTPTRMACILQLYI